MQDTVKSHLMILQLVLDETPWLRANDPEGQVSYIEYSPTANDFQLFLKEVMPEVYIEPAQFMRSVEMLGAENSLRCFVLHQLQAWLESRPMACR
jgi:hypothetical protein